VHIFLIEKKDKWLELSVMIVLMLKLGLNKVEEMI